MEVGQNGDGISLSYKSHGLKGGKKKDLSSGAGSAQRREGSQ